MNELALACVVLLWGRFCGKSYPSHMSPARWAAPFKVPSQNRPVKDSPLQRSTFLGDSSTQWLGICSSRAWYLSIFPSAGYKPCPLIRPGRVAHRDTSARHFDQFPGGNKPGGSKPANNPRSNEEPGSGHLSLPESFERRRYRCRGPSSERLRTGLEALRRAGTSVPSTARFRQIIAGCSGSGVHSPRPRSASVV